MVEMNVESLLERVKGMNSSEILPPQDIGENKKEVVGININHKTKTLSIIVHTEPKEFPDGKRPIGYEPEDSKTVTFSFNQLMWLAPRLEGYRSFLGVENGYEKHGGK